MCLSPSFQGGSESLINTFKEILRCWLHPTFDFSQVSATPLFNLCAYSQNQTSVRHLKNLITVFSLHLFPRDLFWSSRLGGGQDIASVKADRGVLFQSKCLPWSVQAAGGQGYTADVNREAQRPTCISIRIAPTNNHRSVPKCSCSCPVWANWVRLALMWPCWLFQ